MIKAFFRAIRRPFSRPASKTSRSNLVGMYLTQANVRDGYAPEYMSTRSRRNGKFSSRRERV